MITDIDEALCTAVNNKYLIKVYDSSGKPRLIGARKLHKFIGMNGIEVAEELFREALTKSENHEHNLRGTRIRFNKRKSKN